MYKEEEPQEDVLTLGTRIDKFGNFEIYAVEAHNHNNKIYILRINPKTKNVELFSQAGGCGLNVDDKFNHIQVTKIP